MTNRRSCSIFNREVQLCGLVGSNRDYAGFIYALFGFETFTHIDQTLKIASQSQKIISQQKSHRSFF